MTEQLHTPGPWTVDTEPTGLFGDYRINEAYARPFNGLEDLANARLIAAAPLLLAALQALLADVSYEHGSGYARLGPYAGPDSRLACAQAAVAKAAGEAPRG